MGNTTEQSGNNSNRAMDTSSKSTNNTSRPSPIKSDNNSLNLRPIHTMKHAEKAAKENSTLKTSANTNNNVDYHTEDIGAWKSRQENPFDEQNRRSRAEKARIRTKDRKIAPLAFTLAGIAIAGFVVWGVIALISAIVNAPVDQLTRPTISGSSVESINEYRDKLLTIYEKNDDNIEAVTNAVQNTLNTNDGKTHANAVKIAEMAFMWSSGNYTDAVDAGEKIDFDSLSKDQKMEYYNVLYMCSDALGDAEKVNEYYYAMLKLGA